MKSSSDNEDLRLQIAHLRREIESVAAFARNSLKNSSNDPEDWRADMQIVANRLETRLAV